MSIPNLNKPVTNWNLNKKIFVKENAVDNNICDRLVEYGNTHVSKGVNKYPGLFSVSFHACTLPLDHEIHSVLQNTWNECKDYLEIDFDFIEPYELKRYTTRDFFGKHNDNYYGLDENLDRKLTMVIQLSDESEYTNGELIVVDQKFKTKKGSVICFPSFFPHLVSPITDGTRWSLIGWAWGKYWK